MRLPRHYKLTRYKDTVDKGVRYDIHYNGNNIAYALVYPFRSEKRRQIAASERQGLQKVNGPWLEGIVVAPEHQGKGLAQYLLKKVEQAAPNQVIQLLARPYKGKGLSQKELFRFYGERGYKAYDGMKMMKRL
ncbi:MAG: Acetyltransferase domain [Candidatus Parcubacteria bacterium]|jgi:GNAT superfamily N-acetyltransferase